MKNTINPKHSLLRILYDGVQRLNTEDLKRYVDRLILNRLDKFVGPHVHDHPELIIISATTYGPNLWLFFLANCEDTHTTALVLSIKDQTRTYYLTEVAVVEDADPPRPILDNLYRVTGMVRDKLKIVPPMRTDS